MFYPSHLGDEAGIRKANEECNEDNEDRVRVDKGLHPGLAHVGRVGDGEEGEEVGEESQQEAQEHYWVPTFPMETPSTGFSIKGNQPHLTICDSQIFIKS